MPSDGPVAAHRPPNLLVIMPDQLRATALGLYSQSSGPTAPRQSHLEELAGSGARFQHAFTPYPVCVPARVSFWTGRWPHQTGSRSNAIYLQPNESTLLDLLRERDYLTALIGKNHCFTVEQIPEIFDVHYPVGHLGPADDEGDAEVAAVKAFGDAVGTPAYGAGVTPYPREKHGTWLIGDRAEAFLTENGDRPWCAWVSIPDPHTPYRAPEPYASLYPADSILLPPREPPGYPGKPDRIRMFAELLGAHTVTDTHLRFVMSMYFASIAMIDDVIGRLLATLDRTGQREDTIIVFTSDHGDYMTEHGLVRKGASLYDSLVRVPLFVSYPRAIPHGTVSEDLVSTIDVYPTLVRLMGLPLPQGRSGQPLPAITNEPPRQIVFAETGREGTFTNRQQVTHFLSEAVAAGRTVKLPWQLIGNTKLKMARTLDWKYVYEPGADGEDELYDLTADPFELRNLAADLEQQERVAWFRRQLLDWTITSEDTLPPHLTPPPADLAGPE